MTLVLEEPHDSIFICLEHRGSSFLQNTGNTHKIILCHKSKITIFVLKGCIYGKINSVYGYSNFYFSCNKGIKFKFRLSIMIMCNSRPEYHTGVQSPMSLMALIKRNLKTEFLSHNFHIPYIYISNFIYLITKESHKEVQTAKFV